MKAFGKNKAQGSSPVSQVDNQELEAGEFLPETQNTYASIDVAAAKPGGAQVDEYRG